MSKKRLFQVFDEMNVNDELNKTALLPCAFTMVEAKSDKRGGLITMGVEAHIVQKILFGDMQPVLVVMDKKEYYRLEALPLVDKLQAAEEKVQRYEKALKYIATFNLTSEADELDLSDAECGYNAIIETAREALTPKTGKDEKP